MPVRHPFANVHAFRKSLSSPNQNVSWSPSQLMPFKPSRSQSTSRSPRALPPRPQTALAAPRPVLPTIDVHQRAAPSELPNDPVLWSARASPGHYVKHSSKATILLSGQDDFSSGPVYTSGATIEGILAIPRPSGLLTLEVKVSGRIRLKEVAGGGDFKADIINQVLYTWNSDQNGTFPAKVNFRYTLPSHYTNRERGERYRLPPSHEAHLQGIPGFNVDVSYGITVYQTRNRDKADWWRKTSRLHVPFKYRELSRPAQSGPFPLNMTKTPSGPKTLFAFTIPSRRHSSPNVGVHLFLPYSQICSLKESIPFFVTIFGNDEVLDSFSSQLSPPASFHPLSQTDSSGSSLNIQAQLMQRVSRGNTPSVRVHVQRRTKVDALAAGMLAASDKTHMLSEKSIGQGYIHSSTRKFHSMTWSGVILIPSKITYGGFAASGIQVSDTVVLNISPSDGSHYPYTVFCESVPIRLTSESYDNPSASVVVSEMDSNLDR